MTTATAIASSLNRRKDPQAKAVGLLISSALRFRSGDIAAGRSELAKASRQISVARIQPRGMNDAAGEHAVLNGKHLAALDGTRSEIHDAKRAMGREAPRDGGSPLMLAAVALDLLLAATMVSQGGIDHMLIRLPYVASDVTLPSDQMLTAMTGGQPLIRL